MALSDKSQFSSPMSNTLALTLIWLNLREWWIKITALKPNILKETNKHHTKTKNNKYMGRNGNISEEQENHPSAVDCCPQWCLIWLQAKRGYINNQCSKQPCSIIIIYWLATFYSLHCIIYPQTPTSHLSLNLTKPLVPVFHVSQHNAATCQVSG